MNWKINVDVVLVGRVIGLAIIAGGVLLAALEAHASDGGGIFRLGTHQRLREFLGEVAVFSSYAGLPLSAAEIAASLRPRPSTPPRIDWNLTTLIKIYGAAVIAVGTTVALWQLPSEHGSTSGKVRYFLYEELFYFLWQGGLTIVMAGIAERIGWRSQGEGEEHVAPEGPPLSPPA